MLFELLDLQDFHSNVMNYLYRIIQKQTSPSAQEDLILQMELKPKKKKKNNKHPQQKDLTISPTLCPRLLLGQSKSNRPDFSSS